MSLQLENLPFKKFICSLVLLISLPVIAGNILVADNYFVKKQYNLAMKEYLTGAQLGDPRAYYQLGIIHYKGLGTKTDSFKALIWFSLAAEHYYDNSSLIVDELLANVPTAQKNRAITLIDSFKKSFGKQSVNSKYHPKILVNNIDSKVYFGEQKDFEEIDASIDENIEMDQLITDSFDQNQLEDSFEDPFAEDDSSNGINFKDITTSGNSNRLLDGPYLLIADYDIAPDGSIRNISPIRSIGPSKDAIYNLTTSSLPKPKFNNKGVHFVNRSYLGVAGFDKFRIRREHHTLYNRVRRMAAKYAKSDLPQDKYKHAMLLMNFPWLTQEIRDVDTLLKSAAEQGNTLAKFEYGLKLYREQKDIKQAIYWISEATKQGNSQAQYRLARILLDSPWVENDEKKALFWLEAATKQKHPHAKLKSAELKLLAKDTNLHDVNNALLYLNELENEQSDNPQYFYLQAMAHVKMEPRQLSKAVDYIREAIELGEDYNWDVKPWQHQLTKWTSGGRVTIQEL